MITPNTVDSMAVFFARPIEAPSLNLSNADILTCISEKIKIKSRTSPRYGKSMFSLIKSLSELQDEYKCTIYPLHVNEEFWSLFVPYLTNIKHYANSSIRTICAQLKAIVEWASHYGARINASYNECELPADDVRKIALTPDDVSRIYHYNIDSMKRHSQYHATED